MKMGKYLAGYCPGHPRSTPQGVVYQHVLVAEETLGRFLKPHEVVHHIDLDKLNNSPNNLIVFVENSDHVRFHHYGCDTKTLIAAEDGAYFCPKKQAVADKNVCNVCGGNKDRKAKLCISCRNAVKASSVPKSDELRRVLKELNWNYSATGRRYSVSASTVKKWCKKYEIMPM